MKLLKRAIWRICLIVILVATLLSLQNSLSVSRRDVTWKGYQQAEDGLPSRLDNETIPVFPDNYHPTYNDLKNWINMTVEEPVPVGQRKKTNLNTAFFKASVIQHAPWFPHRKQCKETCCVETRAISIDKDKHHIIQTGDGRELADLAIEHYHLSDPEWLKYHKSVLHEDMIPCMVPGTIIFIENHNMATKYFWSTIRPKIQVPYTLILSGSDEISPGISSPHMADPLLIKLYGTNPHYPQNDDAKQWEHKYQSLGLGLSQQHPQEKYLLPYLELTNFTNPFSDKYRQQKWNFAQRPFDYEQDVFVHFGLSSHKKERNALWEVLCPTSSYWGSTVWEFLFPIVNEHSHCNHETIRLSPHDIYTDMSPYRFGISPPGVGYDCYRTYEMLLLGVIPVIAELDPDSYGLFEGLPVVHMPNMQAATTKQNFTDAIQNYIQSDAFQKASFEKGWERLFLKHRRDQILQDYGRAQEIVEDEQGNRYYQGYHYSVQGPNANVEHSFCHKKGHCEHSEGAAKSDWSKPPEVSGEDHQWVLSWLEQGRIKVPLE